MRESRTVAMSSAVGRAAPLLFQSLVETLPEPRAGRRGATIFASAGLHSVFATAIVVLPLLLTESLPSPSVDVYFPAPLEIVTLPPPPLAEGIRGTPRPLRRPDPQQRGFVAPVEIPTAITPDEALDLEGGGGPTGVPGGVPGGVVGSVLTDLPPEPPRPPARVVRISTHSAPRLIRRVAPQYPELAIASRVSAFVILEAEVDTRGRVRAAKVLRGHPLFDDAAIAAVKQWVYQPLLLNGETTGFILNVTIDFRLR